MSDEFGVVFYMVFDGSNLITLQRMNADVTRGHRQEWENPVGEMAGRDGPFTVQNSQVCLGKVECLIKVFWMCWFVCKFLFCCLTEFLGQKLDSQR